MPHCTLSLLQHWPRSASSCKEEMVLQGVAQGTLAELDPVAGFSADAVPICYVNGKRYELPPGRGEGTLLQFLRGAWVTG